VTESGNVQPPSPNSGIPESGQTCMIPAILTGIWQENNRNLTKLAGFLLFWKGSGQRTAVLARIGQYWPEFGLPKSGDGSQIPAAVAGFRFHR
jgi:hypothetical protein